jgi:hypothetical protein
MAAKEHTDLEKPLAFWDLAGTRRAVAWSFIVAFAFIVLAYFPELSHLYEKQSAVKNFLDGLCAALALALAIFELVHSAEANEHRKEQNRLIDKANDSHNEANQYRAEANQLQIKTLELQAQVYQLQEGIEKKLTKIRVYINVQLAQTSPVLLVSNLSEFDVWIERVDLVVTKIESGAPERRLIGENTRISRGNSENGFKLYGGLVGINHDRLEPINVTFYVEVIVMGITDEAVTIRSSINHFTRAKGVQNLEILDKPERSAM